MNKVHEIRLLIDKERAAGIEYGPASWHWQYRNSPYIYLANLDHRLSEGDLLISFSQFGEIVDLKLGRDKTTGDSRGHCWIAYEDPHSKVLAIEGMCGTELLGRTVIVDHAAKHVSMLTDSQQPLTFATIGTALQKRKAELTHRSGEMVELFDLDKDPQLEERRQMIWDYEAFYLDSDDEQFCSIIHERLVNGEELILDEQNQIINRKELATSIKNGLKQKAMSQTIFTLDEIASTHTEDQLDDFHHQNIQSVPTTELITSTKTSFSEQPLNRDHLDDQYGDKFSHLLNSTHPTEISILEQLKNNRLARKQRHHNNDDNGRSDYADRPQSRGDSEFRQRDRNYDQNKDY